jgi:glycosyltransferase involved in cell wall biosynthesis
LAVHGGLGLGMWEEFLASVRGYLRRCRKNDGPLRVAFLIDTIESPTAGTERQLLLLLEGLDRQAFEPRLCVLRASNWLDSEFRLCPMHVLNISSLKSPVTWWRTVLFTLWLRKEGVDILQTHFTDSTKVGIVSAWLARVPGIVATRKNQGYWMTKRELLLQMILNHFSDVFVANSEATKQWAHKNEGIALDHIRVIHNGLAGDLVPFSDERRVNARDILGLDYSLPVAGIVANLRPVKRIDVFLRAAAIAATELPTARFVVVGEGEERGKLEALCVELGLTPQVTFLGRRPDVMDIMPAFDVGVLSSDSESFSNAVVEYMATGLAVVATDVGGCREALGDSSAVALVAPGDFQALGKAMARLLADKNALACARTEHPLRVQNLFSRERYITAYSELYCDLLGVKGERTA